MRKIYSVEEIHNIEKKEFKKLRNSYVLMKRAGTNCAKKIYKSKLNSKFIVLCGPGNNGGDGLVISRILKKLKHDFFGSVMNIRLIYLRMIYVNQDQV